MPGRGNVLSGGPRRPVRRLVLRRTGDGCGDHVDHAGGPGDRVADGGRRVADDGVHRRRGRLAGGPDGVGGRRRGLPDGMGGCCRRRLDLIGHGGRGVAHGARHRTGSCAVVMTGVAGLGRTTGEEQPPHQCGSRQDEQTEGAPQHQGACGHSGLLHVYPHWTELEDPCTPDPPQQTTVVSAATPSTLPRRLARLRRGAHAPRSIEIGWGPSGPPIARVLSRLHHRRRASSLQELS